MPDVQMPSWRTLVVDDDPQIGRQVSERAGYLDEETPYRLIVTSTEQFERALELLQSEVFDLLILDVRLGRGSNEAEAEIGVRTLEKIQIRRFIPTVFYTGLPRLVNHLKTPLVRVVEKTEGLERLFAVLDELIGTKLPRLNRAVLTHIQAIQAEYMWTFVSENWAGLSAERDGLTLAYLLARRLAASLSGSRIGDLAEALGQRPEAIPQTGSLHPAEYYIMPPLMGAPSLAGDIHALANDEYRIVLTPSCDLVQKKAEFILWANCVPLARFTEYQNWRSDQSKEGPLKALLRNNRAKQPDRYFFLPGAYAVPDLIVDFEQLSHVECSALDSATRIASLDSPIAELVLSRFVRFFGRIGAPDLDPVVVMSRLNAERQ